MINIYIYNTFLQNNKKYFNFLIFNFFLLFKLREGEKVLKKMLALSKYFCTSLLIKFINITHTHSFKLFNLILFSTSNIDSNFNNQEIRQKGRIYKTLEKVKILLGRYPFLIILFTNY